MACCLFTCKGNIWKPEVYITHSLAALRGKSWIALNLLTFIKQRTFVPFPYPFVKHRSFSFIILFYFAFFFLLIVVCFFKLFSTCFQVLSEITPYPGVAVGAGASERAEMTDKKWKSWNLPLDVKAEIALEIICGHAQVASSLGDLETSQDRPYTPHLGWASLGLPSYLGAHNYSTKMKVHLWQQTWSSSLKLIL